MFYYIVPSKTTTDTNGMTTTAPDLPSGTPFVGSLGTSDFLIATPTDLSTWAQAINVTDLETTATSRGLAYADVLKWNVGVS